MTSLRHFQTGEADEGRARLNQSAKSRGCSSGLVFFGLSDHLRGQSPSQPAWGKNGRRMEGVCGSVVYRAEQQTKNGPQLIKRRTELI